MSKDNVVIFNYFDAYLADKITNEGRKILSQWLKQYEREKKLKKILNDRKNN